MTRKATQILCGFGSLVCFCVALWIYLTPKNELSVNENVNFNSDLKHVKEMYINRISSALNKLLDFFIKYVHQVNMDCVIGIAVMRDLLPPVIHNLEQCADRKDLNPGTVWNLQAVLRKTMEFVTEGTKYAKLQDPEYFGDGNMISTKLNWDTDLPKRHIEEDYMKYLSIKVDYSVRETFAENISDPCIDEFFVSDNVQHGVISESCFEFMTNEKLMEYGLTHQVIAIIIGMKRGYTFELDQLAGLKFGGKSIGFVLDRLCLNSMKEALNIQRRKYPNRLRDLFMEHVQFCALSGYDEFYQPHWLDQILSWQDPIGCYKRDKEKNQNAVEVSTNKSDKRELKRRMKRREQMMEFECSGHETSVAAGTLMVYLKHISNQLAEKSKVFKY